MKVAHYYPNEYSRRFRDYLPPSVTVTDNSCDGDVDVIYCGAGSCLPDALIAKHAYNKPLVCWVWNLPHDASGRVNDSIGLKSLITALRTDCCKVISASKSTQRELCERGVESEQMYFYADIVPDGSPKVENKVVQVSRIVPCKRFEVSIEAVRGTRAKLTCVGISKDASYYNSLSKCNVEFLHNVSYERVAREISEAAILVSPSISEGFGLTPIEAVMCGTPIIVSDIPVFREVYGGDALYHAPDDAYDLHCKIKAMLDDELLRKTVVDGCRERVRSFTPRLFAERWMKMITE